MLPPKWDLRESKALLGYGTAFAEIKYTKIQFILICKGTSFENLMKEKKIQKEIKKNKKIVIVIARTRDNFRHVLVRSSLGRDQKHACFFASINGKLIVKMTQRR